MDIKSMLLQKKNLWHVGAILLFLLISVLYMSPNLDGYSVKQADIVNFVGMSREVQDYRLNADEQVLWTNAMFSGMPSTQISVLYEGDWLSSNLRSAFTLGLPYPLAFLFIYFIGFYILGISLRIKPLVSTLGSIAFGLSSYFLIIIEAGHNSKAAAIGFVPLMLAGFILTYRSKNYILAAAFAALGMMLELATNHVQITYYTAFLLLFIGVIELVKALKSKELPSFLKRTSFLLMGYLLAILVNYGNIFGTLDYAKHTIRGGSELTITADGSNSKDQVNENGLDKDYVTNWSYGINETFTFLVPNFKGGESQALGSDKKNRDYIKAAPRQFQQDLSQSGNQYWGDQPFTSGPVYIGVIMIFLGILSLLYVQDKYKWALLSATLLAITLSWGKNFVSVLIIIPILAYLANIFIEDTKKRFTFNAGVTALFIILLALGTSLTKMSLTDLFLDYMPGYNKLRAVTIILVIAELCIPILAILFLNYLVNARKEISENIMPLIISSSVLLLVLVGFYVSPTTFNNFLSTQELARLGGIEDPNQLAGYEAFYDELVQVRQSIFKSDVGRSIGFLIAGAGLIFAFVKLNLNKYLFLSILTVFVFADLYSVDQRYLSSEKKGKNYDQWTESYKQTFPFNEGKGEAEILRQEIALNPKIEGIISEETSALKKELKLNGASNLEIKRQVEYLKYRILNRHTNFRVLDIGNSYNSSYVGYFNKSIGGYHGAKLSRYQDLIEFHLSKNNQAVLNMLNTKYLIQTIRNNRNEISDSKLISINQNAMGNAWLSKEVKFVENANEEIQALASAKQFQIDGKSNTQVLINGQPLQGNTIPEGQSISVIPAGMTKPIQVNVPYQALQNEALAAILDSAGVNWAYDSTPDSVVQKLFTISLSSNSGWTPAKTTIIDKRFKDSISQSTYPATGSIVMTDYHPDRITYQFNSESKELAVFSEIYYANGWTAYVDKQPMPISRVNYVLRAIEVPAGEHTIEFVYESEIYETSGGLANIGSVGILILLAIGLYFEVKKK